MLENRNKFTYRNERILSAPVMINLEITSGCNLKCRHCYNYWRDESIIVVDNTSMEKMQKLIEMIIADEVFHVVLTGGEPFLNFEVLEYALMKLHDAGISTSVNSNLMYATPEKIRRLKKVGMDHVLTSLNSHIKETNDYMLNQKGAFDKIIRNIKITIDEGIRVSVNMIISDINKDHVYGTAKLCCDLGVQRIFGTRLVPSVNVKNPDETDFRLDVDNALRVLDDLINAKKNFGIGIGTLISYPLCLFGDLEKYEDFVGRGCPSQRGNRMVVNANGDTHACTHESISYGNVFEIGIKEAFKRMKNWHDGTYLYEECMDCRYINICGSGCRSAAYSYFKRMNARDPLFVGENNIKNDYKITIPEEIEKAVDGNETFIVPERVRFRNENGFYTINIRWANAYSIGSKLAEYLIAKQASGEKISLGNMIGDNPRKDLIALVFKEAVMPSNPILRNELEKGVKVGSSIDPEDIPSALYNGTVI